MLKTKEEIQEWLTKHKIRYTTINQDLTVDVDDTVDLSEQGLKKIPIQFGRVNGTFDVSLNKLKSLKGSPSICHGYFACYHNQLTSLEYAPTFVGLSFDCSHNQLTTLKGAPSIVIQHFNCSHNQLTNLEYLPKTTNAYFVAESNNLLNIENITHLRPQKIDLSNNPNLEDFTPLNKIGSIRILKLESCKLNSLLQITNLTVTDAFYHSTNDDTMILPGLEEYYTKKDDTQKSYLELDAQLFHTYLEKIRLENQVQIENRTKKIKI